MFRYYLKCWGIVCHRAPIVNVKERGCMFSIFGISHMRMRCTGATNPSRRSRQQALFATAATLSGQVLDLVIEPGKATEVRNPVGRSCDSQCRMGRAIFRRCIPSPRFSMRRFLGSR